MNLIKTRRMLTMIILVGVLCIHMVFAIGTNEINNYRIKIHSTASSVIIRVDSGYELYIDNSKVNYNISSSGEEITFAKSGNLVSVSSSNNLLGTGSVVNLKKKDSAVRYFEVKNIDGVAFAKYPDNVTLRVDSKNTTLLVINETPIETYLKGVIPYEIGASAPLEAMKAQAVTARTVAVKRVNKNAVDGYDITNTTSDQVYKGYNATYFASTHNVSKAVEATKGVVLTYNGALVEGTFYSNNGGQTASDGFVWSSGNSTPYYSSKADKFDEELHKSMAGWGQLFYEESFTKKELRERILKSLVDYPGYFKPPYCTPAFNGLSDNYTVEVVSSTNGYVTQVKLSDDTGRVYNIKNYANRWFFALRSQQYTLKQTGGVVFTESSTNTTSSDAVYVKNSDGKITKVDASDLKIKSANGISEVDSIKYVFNGKGYGHGIGMSQNGAMNRAEAGQTYKDILSFYYEGTKTSSNYGN